MKTIYITEYETIEITFSKKDDDKVAKIINNYICNGFKVQEKKFLSFDHCYTQLIKFKTK